MKDKFELSLLESGEMMRHGVGKLIDNIGRVIALITIIVTSLVLFTDIGFADFGTESFTSTLAVMLIASYIMYFSMSEAGERAGEDTEEYKNAEKKCTELSSMIGGESIGALRAFCKDYSEEELRYRKESFLIHNGYTGKEYDSYRSGAVFDKKVVRIFKRAERLKAVSLTPKALLSREKLHEKSELANPESSKLLHMILKLLPTTLCMLVTVSVMLTAKEDLTSADIIDGLFKLSSLPVIGFRGYAAGYSYKKRVMPLWLDTKSRMLEAFLNKQASLTK